MMAWVDSSNNNVTRQDSWTWPPVQAGNLKCVICGKVISFPEGNTNEFFQHIEVQHKVFIHHGLLLSILFLDNQTQDNIRSWFRKNILEESLTGGGDTFIEDGDDADYFEEAIANIFGDFRNKNERKRSFIVNLYTEDNGKHENELDDQSKPGSKSSKMKQLLKKDQQQRLFSKPNDLPNSHKTQDYEMSSQNETNSNHKSSLEDLTNVFQEKYQLNQNLKTQNKTIQSETNIDNSEKLTNRSDNTIKHLFAQPKDDKILYKSGLKSRKNKRSLKIENDNDLCKENGVNKFVNFEVAEGINRSIKRKSNDESDKVKKKITSSNTDIEDIETNAESMLDEIKQLLKDCDYDGLSNLEEQIDSKLECGSFDDNNTFDSKEHYIENSEQGENDFDIHKYIENLMLSADSINGPEKELIKEEIKNITKSLDLDSIEVQNSDVKYPPINITISEYFQKRPKQISLNIYENLKKQFLLDESLPYGWKIRKVWRENKKAFDIDYLSPDGRKLRSKVAVIEYMKLMGIYGKQDYDKLIQNYDLDVYRIQ